MKSDEKILEEFTQCLSDHVLAEQVWRDEVVFPAYAQVAGHVSGHWDSYDWENQKKDGFPCYIINKTSPVIDAVSGFEIQTRREIRFFERNSPRGETADYIEDVVKYIEDDSRAPHERSGAFRDLCICGLGGTHAEMRYEENIDGEPEVERVFPHMLLWDPAARKKNLTDANWVGRAKVIDAKALEDLLGEEGESSYRRAGASEDDTFMKYYRGDGTGGKSLDRSTGQTSGSGHQGSLSVIYEYQWRDLVPIYKARNPMMDQGVAQAASMMMPEMAAAAQNEITAFFQQNEIDPSQAILTLEPKVHKEFKAILEPYGLPMSSTKVKTYKYYRALIAGGRVVEKDELISQDGFTIKFMTGKYDEIRMCFVGLPEAMRDPQRILNKAISDLHGLSTGVAPVMIESDATPDLQGFLDTYRKFRETTIVAPGAIMAGKVKEKQVSEAYASLSNLIPMANEYIMGVAGITPDMMGVIENADTSGVLYNQKVRQTRNTLAPYFDAVPQYIKDCGKMWIWFARDMAENHDGRILPRLTNSKADPLALSKDRLIGEYDIVVEEAPQSLAEEQQIFDKLMALAPGLLQVGSNIMPMAMKFAPLDKPQIDELMQIMQPPPPPQPDPLAQQTLQAEIMYKNAMAQKLASEAKKIDIEAMLKHKELANDTTDATRTKIITESIKNLASVGVDATRLLPQIVQTNQEAFYE